MSCGVVVAGVVVAGVEVAGVVVAARAVVVVGAMAVVVMDGMTTTFVDEVVGTAINSGAPIAIEVEVVVESLFPTTRENIGEFAKLNEFPVQVPPVGLSRPYAYIWYVSALVGAVTVTLKVAVLRSADRVGPLYTPLIQGLLRTM